jgi:hypothetical protein
MLPFLFQYRHDYAANRVVQIQRREATIKILQLGATIRLSGNVPSDGNNQYSAGVLDFCRHPEALLHDQSRKTTAKRLLLCCKRLSQGSFFSS